MTLKHAAIRERPKMTTRNQTMTKRILLCDDEIHILRAAEFKLKRAGYDVRIAGDGEEAWEPIQDQTARHAGHRLPDAAAGRLRPGPAASARTRDTADLPVLMLTAKGFELRHEELAEKWNVHGGDRQAVQPARAAADASNSPTESLATHVSGEPQQLRLRLTLTTRP